LVTGASTGIGKACALHLDDLGYRVYAGVRRESDRRALLQEASSRLQAVILDVCDAVSVSSAIEQIKAGVGQAGLAGLVNNAGISVAGPLEFLPLEDLRRQLEVNVVGQIAVTQACLPLLRLGRGRIVMMSSTSGLFASPFLGPYAASKFALEALSDSLRLELRRWGMAVVLVEPGAIVTPIWSKSLSVARSMRENLPELAQANYGDMMDRVELLAKGSAEKGLPAEAVARVVAEALSVRRPRARYQVVRPASGGVRRLLLHTPTPMRDWLVARWMR
jgi:NAD(P)-dependent dehydrogenase (short-subunit alcohol dehydrogenase family)